MTSKYILIEIVLPIQTSSVLQRQISWSMYKIDSDKKVENYGQKGR